jgi:hypothetical protein
MLLLRSAVTSLFQGKNDLFETLQRVPLSACYSTINKLLAAENITDVKSAVKVAE